MHAIEKDKKEMEEEKEKQRLAEEQRRSSQVEQRIQTDSAPPPSPAAAMSPVGSTSLLEETPLATRPASGVSSASNAQGSSEGNLKTTKPDHTITGNTIPEKRNEVTKDIPHPSGESLEDNKTFVGTQMQEQRSLPPRPGASPKEDLGKRERASSLRTKSRSRTPSPREGGKGKRSSSAKD